MATVISPRRVDKVTDDLCEWLLDQGWLPPIEVMEQDATIREALAQNRAIVESMPWNKMTPDDRQMAEDAIDRQNAGSGL
jgi:hypothetical protein